MLLSVVLLIFTIYKSKRRKRDLGFFFAIFGLTFLIETLIYIFLKSYEYFPKIIPQSPKNDGVVGNIVSQFSISVVAVFVCVFDIPFIGVFLGGTMFYLIEKLFLALGIYREFWYRPWITLVGVVVTILLIKKWYQSFLKSNSPKMHYFTVLAGVLALYLPTTNWIGILSGFVVFKENILIDPFISHAVVAIPKYLTQMNVIYFLIRYNAKWIWKVTALAGFIISDLILYYTKIIDVKEGWLLMYSAISFLTAYIYVVLMEKLLYGNIVTDK